MRPVLRYSARVMTTSWMRTLALALAVLIGLGSSGLAMAGASMDLQHEVSQSEPHAPSQGGADCDHCCACHSTAHLSGALAGAATHQSAPVTSSAVPVRDAPFLSRSADTFLRPPRLS